MTTTTQHTAAGPAAPQRPPSSPLAAALRTAGIALAAVLVAWAAVQAADWASSSEGEQRLTYDGVATVELVADGPVTVRAGEPGAVEVRREWREGLRPVRYDAVETPDRLLVTHDCPWFLNACRAALDVTVPAETNVVVRASDGHIQVAGIAGDLMASTGSGSITIERVGGDVVARTGSGSVVALEVDGEADLRSGSGSIEAKGIGGSLEARASSGRVDARGVGGEALARSGSGDVFVADVASHIDAHASSGRVTVHGSGVPVALDISTSSGRQTVEAATDPNASVTVRVRSSSGDVAYLAPLP